MCLFWKPGTVVESTSRLTSPRPTAVVERVGYLRVKLRGEWGEWIIARQYQAEQRWREVRQDK